MRSVIVTAILTYLLIAGAFLLVAPDEFQGPGQPTLVHEAKAKQALWDARDEDPAVVIVGSSRASSVPVDVFEEPAFNFGIAGSSAVDHMNVIEQVRRDATEAHIVWFVAAGEFVDDTSLPTDSAFPGTSGLVDLAIHLVNLEGRYGISYATDGSSDILVERSAATNRSLAAYWSRAEQTSDTLLARYVQGAMYDPQVLSAALDVVDADLTLVVGGFHPALEPFIFETPLGAAEVGPFRRAWSSACDRGANVVDWVEGGPPKETFIDPYHWLPFSGALLRDALAGPALCAQP